MIDFVKKTKAVFFLILLSLSILCLSSCSEGAADLAPGRPIKNFKLKTLDGQEVDLYQRLSANKKSLLVFMASWCISCKSDIPNMNQLHSKMSQNESGKVLAIALDDTIDALRQLKGDYGINFEILYDSQSKSRKYFKLTGFPEYILLDQKFSPKLVQLPSSDMSIKMIGPQDWLLLETQIVNP